MMSRRWLYAIAIALALYGNVAAQQAVPVARDNKDDPCDRFKLRILTPAGNVDYKLRVQRPAAGIDPEIVWNPCHRDEPRLVFSPSVVRPDDEGGHFAPQLFGFGPSRESGGGGNPPESPRSRMPPAFEMMRRRRLSQTGSSEDRFRDH